MRGNSTVMLASWDTALGLGSACSKAQGAKIKGAITNINAAPPKMYCAPKDHKTMEPGQEHLGPDGRPICGAREAPNGQLSTILSKVINTCCDKEKGRMTTESGSSEDILSKIDSANSEPPQRWLDPGVHGRGSPVPIPGPIGGLPGGGSSDR